MSDANGPAVGGHQLFISFCSHDRFIAERLCRAIEERGNRCWISTRDVPPGSNYQECISAAIETASAMILVFSVHSNNSSEVKKELALAGQYNTVVIPVRTEDVLPAGAFRYELSTRQWVDLFASWDGAVEQIVERIRELITDETGIVDPPWPGSGGKPGQPWPPRPSLRRVALLVLASLAAAGVLTTALVTAWPRPVPDAPSNAKPLPPVAREDAGDKPALYPETDATRQTAFTLCTSATEVKPGFRHWSRVAPDRWLEEYPDGTRTYMGVLKRINVATCDGSVLGTPFDASFQVFVPDRGCMWMVFLFRRLPTQNWTSYVAIDKPDLTCRPAAASAQ